MEYVLKMFGRLLVVLIRKRVIDLQDIHYITDNDKQFYIFISEALKEKEGDKVD